MLNIIRKTPIGRLCPTTIRDCTTYPSPQVAEESRQVRSLSGLIIVLPQYNWGYPGELKNCFGHISHERTYGGHGGGKAGAQLRQVLERGMEFQAVSQGELEISLPREYMAGTQRVKESGVHEAVFLKLYESMVERVWTALVTQALSFRRQ